MSRGFFAIGIEHSKTEKNVGMLWRTASLYDAAFVFTIGHRYQRSKSDTTHVSRHRPLFHFEDIDDLYTHLPHGVELVGVELDERAHQLGSYVHPESAVYLLGAEDHGLSGEAMRACDHFLQVPYPSAYSMNVAVAGSIVMYDRFIGRNK